MHLLGLGGASRYKQEAHRVPVAMEEMLLTRSRRFLHHLHPSFPPLHRKLCPYPLAGVWLRSGLSPRL